MTTSNLFINFNDKVMKWMNVLQTVTLLYALGFVAGCKKNVSAETIKPSPVNSVISTDSVVHYSSSVISAGGIIMKAAGITDKGIIWGTDSNSLTVTGINKISNGTGSTNFTDTIQNLIPNTVYYVKAYAIVNLQPSYGAAIAFTTDPVVYIGGYDGSSAKYWRNGTPVALSVNSSSVSGWIHAIYAQGTNVQATGEIETAYAAIYAPYWENGISKALTDTNAALKPSTYTTGVGYAMFVQGTDVYIAGYELLNGVWPVAKYWKNGVGVSFTDGTLSNDGIAYGIYIKGTDVYVAGFTSNRNMGTQMATYWKNGDPVYLNDSTKSMAVAHSIFVDSSNNVYVAGSETPGVGISFMGTQVAKYWKNGKAIALTDGTEDACAFAVFVSNGTVYAAGYEYNPATGLSDAKYWKNSTPYTLTNNGYFNSATSIYVQNNDVYVAGWANDYSRGYNFAKYWKNGVDIPLISNSHYSTGSCIFLQ